MQIDYCEILHRIEQCKPFITNWELIEGINFDFSLIDIDALIVEKREDLNGRGWAFILSTTMYTIPDNNGRDIYTVRWRFNDVWGNMAFFKFAPPGTSGALCLELQDYGDFARVDFSIIPNERSHFVEHNELTGETTFSHKYGPPIFIFYEPDETAVASVELREHYSLSEIRKKTIKTDLDMDDILE